MCSRNLSWLPPHTTACYASVRVQSNKWLFSKDLMLKMLFLTLLTVPLLDAESCHKRCSRIRTQKMRTEAPARRALGSQVEL